MHSSHLKCDRDDLVLDTSFSGYESIIAHQATALRAQYINKTCLCSRSSTLVPLKLPPYCRRSALEGSVVSVRPAIGSRRAFSFASAAFRCRLINCSNLHG